MISIFIKAPKLRGIKLRQKPVSLINFQHGNRTRDRVGERGGGGGEVEKTHFHTHWRMGFVPRLIFNCWKMLLSMKNYLLIKLSPASVRRFFPPLLPLPPHVQALSQEVAWLLWRERVRSSPAQSDRVASSVLRPLSFSVDAQMIQHSVFNLL